MTNDVNKKPVLVTGGCGFVGRHLVNKLIKKGNSVWIVDNLFTGWHPDKWLRGYDRKEDGNLIKYTKNGIEITFIEADALDFFLDEIKSRPKIKLPAFSDVYHLASIVGGRALIDGDPIQVATDLAIDSLFFVWATRNKEKIERVMYTSSSAAYPIHLQSESNTVALAENLIRFDHGMGLPDMTYGWSKLSGEYLARFAAKHYGMHVACVRPFSGYGEDQDTSYPVPAIASRIAKRENPMTVWGTGEQGRDFVHIDDCIEAMFIVLDKISDGSGINIGTGKLLSFNEIIRTFAKIEKYEPSIKQLLDKPVGVQARHAHPEKIFSLGWKPEISLEDGLTRVLNYAKENKTFEV
ncbi:MAG: epimerase [Candidatus Harrisonbacteria bacterium CG10_big_fil_rev_8_21_14_0_10_40_38]|uniref:Epimerase n=1 Tax=Candidatus Harrisonbacteria bacterium CG10_big_fil_rev_8_21_14_0_10_40_38 TaxID=1974583 RepID=A0A2H0URN4_9BACT|nr:MAG: epimerase [Candidatus Harrisonbacteria bacterium CG10_big_fil_rev_8_21_14_0_10_40_38]